MNLFCKSAHMTSPHLFLIHLHFFFFLMINISEFPLGSHGCHEHERRALLDFKSSLDDPSNRLSSWQEGIQHQNCCRWHGIKCSHKSFHIVSVDLRNKDYEDYLNSNEESDDSDPPNTTLTGKLSSSLFNITHLEYLDLALNDFQESKIPLHLSHLNKLTHLDLSFSNFSASISTQFNNLTSLRYLDLSCTGDSFDYSASCLELSSIKWVKGLGNLKLLNLKGANMSKATNFPEHISHLSNLEYLDISDCSISTTSFPINEFHNLSRLSILKMRNNNFISDIPVQIVNLTSLSTLDLYGCKLHGSVPYLPQLTELLVSNNADLHLDLTKMFQRGWPKLETLSISSTNVSGSIPVHMANLTSLSILELSDCELQGSVPYLPQLKELDVSYNIYLHPDLTKMFQHPWPKLQTLSIAYTNVSGPIPVSISSNAPLLVTLSASLCSIQGSLPSSIFNLSKLQTLDLSHNNILGYIPISICQMSSLRELDLRRNNITGTIPSCLTNHKNLTSIQLSGNFIGGTVSLIDFINGPNLITLDLSANRLTVEIDQRFHLYSKFKLQYLMLSSCNLGGLFPTFICKLNRLLYLDLSQNNLTGVIPSYCISKLNFSYLNLSSNNFFGPLPLPPPRTFIILFDISNNKLSGEISTECGKRLATCSSLNLARNELSGQIPFSIFSNNSLVYVDLSNNKLSGPIPNSICSKGPASDLSTIDLSNNRLSGNIPDSIGYCSLLQSLNLGTNNLTGNVPNELQHVKELWYLQLNDNNLNGAPLELITKIQGLQVINLANNHFGGTIPIGLGSAFLSILSLRSNKFSGSIPQEFSNWEKLQILDLSWNNLTGLIPKEIGNLMMLRSRPNDISFIGDSNTNVQVQMVIKGIMVQVEKLYAYNSAIDLSCNALEGDIPHEIGLLKGLSSLNISHNHFSGVIPKSVGNMSGLESLDLSFNKLSGNIPQSLVSINSLGYLNLSYNNLSGRIPRDAHFDTLSGDGSAYLGNSLLCGFYTNHTCEGDQTDIKHPNGSYEDDKEDAKEKLLLYAIVALGFGVGFWGLFFVLLLKKGKWWFGYWRLVDVVALRVANCMLEKKI